MAKKFEIIRVDEIETTVDVSELLKKDKMFFNATEIAKPFEKQPSDFLRLESTSEYINFLSFQTGLKRTELFKVVNGGRHNGTWMHQELALEFARWLDVRFRYLLNKIIEQKLKDAQDWRLSRYGAAESAKKLAEAINQAHDPVKFYHFSNGFDLINRLVFGMPAKKIRETYGCEPRERATSLELEAIDSLEKSEARLVLAGKKHEEIKAALRQRVIEEFPEIVEDNKYYLQST